MHLNSKVDKGGAEESTPKKTKLDLKKNDSTEGTVSYQF